MMRNLTAFKSAKYLASFNQCFRIKQTLCILWIRNNIPTVLKVRILLSMELQWGSVGMILVKPCFKVWEYIWTGLTTKIPQTAVCTLSVHCQKQSWIRKHDVKFTPLQLTMMTSEKTYVSLLLIITVPYSMVKRFVKLFLY